MPKEAGKPVIAAQWNMLVRPQAGCQTPGAKFEKQLPTLAMFEQVHVAPVMPCHHGMHSLMPGDLGTLGAPHPRQAAMRRMGLSLPAASPQPTLTTSINIAAGLDGVGAEGLR